MGQDNSKQPELSEESLQIWQQLMAMGFDDNIALDAVKRNGTKIGKCINYILKQNKNAPHQKTQEDTKTDDPQTYKDRIDSVLMVSESQRETHDQSQVQDIYSLVEEEYANKNGIDGFVEDCGEYAMNIDGIYADNVNKCELDECPFIQREFRDRNVYDKNEEERFKLYSHCEDEKSVVIQQFLDQLHINKYHLTDIGLRSIGNNANDNDGYHQVIANRKRFNTIRNDGAKSNKFVTQILDHDEDDSKHNQYTPYSFGVRFYYHKYYKNNNTKQERLPGARGMPEQGNMHINTSYSYSSWFVSPKHKTIKDEVLNDAKHGLTMIQYENTVLKAMMKHKAMSGTIKGANYKWKIVYEIPEGSPIRMKHILAVLLYTNHSDLSAAFSRSFRKVIGSESDNELKERHSHYANWARLLREAVECWGYALWETTQTRSTFYHGISKKMIFDWFDQRFCCPTSTTLQYETAIMFANQGQGDEDGIVISIKNTGH
eukprot:121539_1